MFIENARASNSDDPAVEPEAASRLGEIRVPTLVVTGARYMPATRSPGDHVVGFLDYGSLRARRNWRGRLKPPRALVVRESESARGLRFLSCSARSFAVFVASASVCDVHPGCVVLPPPTPQ